MFEACIERKGICWGNVTAFGMFGEWTEFSTGEGLESSLDLGIG